MTLLRLLLAVLLVLAMTEGAAALVLTTPQFPGADVTTGFAWCSVTNGSTTTTNSSIVVMRDGFGNVMSTNGPLNLGPGDTDEGNRHGLASVSPQSCRCTVPNSAHKCAFVYVNSSGGAIVIPATPN
jgi:hypothetical protein